MEAVLARPLADDDRLLTVAEFEQLPEEDAYRIELVRGRLVRSPRPASLHARLLARLVHGLYEFVEEEGRGVVLADPGVVLSRNPDTVRGPDIAFFSIGRIPETSYATTFWGPPDLAVEITSPSNRVSEVQEKVGEYLDAGVRLVWVVDPPSRTVTVYRTGGTARMLRQDGVLEGDNVLPGFRLSLAAFFAL
jgi:Uma2 family endonuclease